MRIVETIAPSKRLGIMNWIAGVREPSESEAGEEIGLQRSHSRDNQDRSQVNLSESRGSVVGTGTGTGTGTVVEMTGPRDMVSNSGSGSSNSGSVKGSTIVGAGLRGGADTGAGGGGWNPAPSNASNAETQSLYSQSSYRASTLIDGTTSRLGYLQQEPSSRLEQVLEEPSSRLGGGGEGGTPTSVSFARAQAHGDV
ncbi:hypothetical protein K435DRAFT_166990 [Dendrothele bispora CBS 962.96]|uniref:Uncharacterized protein n=1 Tax=Dendrothele bispora (strain CBS 962.96) TaxID=1314807 RepID=A0A4S8LX20_DENBC|nr:hypothetical protein K435DRAFT_166990 [Dendrothele bispora CBS 962.96]